MSTVEEKVKAHETRQDLEKLYTKNIADLFFSQGISKLNILVGLQSQSQFSLGLFLKLGINFDFTYVKEEKSFKIPKDMDLKDNEKIVDLILSNLKAYVINSDLVKKAEVNMKFNYHNEDQMKMIKEALETPIGITFLLFVYLHEVQHILRKHNTSVFNEIMLRTAKTVDSKKYTKYEEVHKFANFAQDYCINNALSTLFDKSGGAFKKDMTIISKYGLFEPRYEKDNEVDVLIKLLKSEPEITVISEDEHSITCDIQEKNEDGSNKGDVKRVTIPKQGEGQGEGTPEEESAANRALGNIADSIQGHIDSQKLKGEGNFLLNEDIGPSIKTNIDWFDKLKSTIFTIVNRKTKQTLVNWSKLNAKYSHNHKSPTHKNITNTLEVILSVDNSGSMSTESLKKLLYIIEKKKSKISKLTILKHTDSISGILENETDESKILDFLSKRDSGGTSHKEVFQYLDEHINKAQIDQAIFISFSDNYSDIETMYNKYKNIRRITKVWLNCDGKPVESFIPGLKIDIF